MKIKMILFIVIAAFVQAGLGLYQYIESDANEKELKGKMDKLKTDNDTLISKIDSLKEHNYILKDKLDSLKDENILLYKEIIDTKNNIIGLGDLEIILNPMSNREFIFEFYNNGELSINNASVLIVNYSELKKCKIYKEELKTITFENECAKGKYTELKNLNINPKSNVFNSDLRYKLGDGYSDYIILISSKNKITVQNIVCKLINGKIVTSKRIYDLINGEQILKMEDNSLNLNLNYWDLNFTSKTICRTDI
jgi:hypothetical protein